jgi:hypothetical protein
MVANWRALLEDTADGCHRSGATYLDESGLSGSSIADYALQMPIAKIQGVPGGFEGR